jgi:serine/threonine protein kinase
MCSAKDLISKLLVTDATRRLTPAAALAHPWLNSPITDHALTRTRENMRRHLTAKRRFKARTLNLTV